MKTFIYCSLICCISICATCNKRIDCKQTIYSFEANLQVFPDIDSVRIGDTVWLNLNHPSTLYDSGLRANVDYSNAMNYGTVFRIVELLGNSNFRGAYTDFDLLLKTGKTVNNYSDPNFLREFTFEELGNFYVFNLGFAAKKRGIYRISFDNSNNVFRANDQCTKAGFKLSLKNTNSHGYFNNANFTGITTDTTRLYCFKVY
jgi:hypothetical protein